MRKSQLVLIHGIVGTLHYYDPGALLTGPDVHSIDLLGYGSHRSADTEGLTLSTQANHVLSCIAQLGVDRVWLLAHSMGGAVAMILADRHPELVSAIINVEGNFTMKDAFWSRKIVDKTPENWRVEYESYLNDVPATLRHWGVEPTPRRLDWIHDILTNQPAGTLYAMARAIVTETQESQYLPIVRRVVDGGVPLHLIAGERSAEDWGLPDFVREKARSYTQIPDTGHLMMLEKPEEFCRVIDAILAEHAIG